MRLSTRKRIVGGLLLAAVVAVVLPTSWTGRFISVLQVIVPFQHAASSAVRPEPEPAALGGEAGGFEGTTVWEREALRHQVAALTARVAELEGEVALLSATRLWDAAGERIGAKGQLVPAAVVIGDLLPWRSSTLINAGTLQGVSANAPVLSNHFTIELGSEHGLRQGLAVLLGESLIGWVEQIGTHTSRVKLLSDPTVQMKVRVGRFATDKFTVAEGYFWLTGRGRGRMQIRDVKRSDVKEGVVRAGDVVLSDPSNAALPAAMTIGKITEIAPDRENPLLAVLTVAPAVDPATLRRVYVYDLGA